MSSHEIIGYKIHETAGQSQDIAPHLAWLKTSITERSVFTRSRKTVTVQHSECMKFISPSQIPSKCYVRVKCRAVGTVRRHYRTKTDTGPTKKQWLQSTLVQTEPPERRISLSHKTVSIQAYGMALRSELFLLKR